MKVLIACEYSGVVRDAFIKKGHEAISCDLLPTESKGPHYQGDVLILLQQESFDLMIAHPPCTYLCASGARWFKNNPSREVLRDEAVRFFMALVNAPIDRICIENPIGYMSTHYHKPDQIVHPYHFGHNVSKATCLWLKNLPLLQSTKVVEPDMVTLSNGKRVSRWSGFAPIRNRSHYRSKTFEGIAEAMAEQW